MAGGRPTNLNKRVQAAIVKRLKVGMPVEYAALAAGICRQTFYNWRRLGIENPDSIHGQFLGAIKKAEAEFMDYCLSAVKAARPRWQSRAWLLERKWPELWSSDRELVTELKRFLRDQKKLQREKESNGPTDPPAGEAAAQS
jgi:transposase